MIAPTYLGQVMPLITVPPDWSQRPTLQTHYHTVIREALDLSEERHQRRPRCLYGLQFTTQSLTAQETAWLRKTFERAQALPMGVPIWPSIATLTADAPAGATVLQTSSLVGRMFSVFKHAVIWVNFNSWELVELSDATQAGQLGLAIATDNAWSAGSVVVPVAWGHVPRPDETLLSAEHAQVPIEFQERLPYLLEEEGPWPIDPLVVSLSQNACKSNVVLSWNAAPGFLYVVEYSAVSSSGPWVTYADPVPGGAVSSVEIVNAWSTATWWRVKAKAGSLYSSPSAAQGAVATSVAACSISITGTTLLPSGSIPPDGARSLHTPVAGAGQAPLIHDGPDLVAVSERRDYYFDPGNVVSSTISVTCPTAGATVLYTTDGTLPTIAGPNPVDSPAGNGFGCIIKARAYKDGCYGPLTIVLVDKRIRLRNNIGITGSSRSLIGNCVKTTYWRQPGPPGPGGEATCVSGTLEKSSSCLINYPLGILAELKKSACASLTTGTSGSKLYSQATTYSEGTPIPEPPGSCSEYLEWGGEAVSASVTIFLATALNWSKPPYFTSLPTTPRNYLITQKCGANRRYQPVGGVTGPSGSTAAVDAELAQILVNCVPSCNAWPSSDVLLEEVDLVLTRDDDTPILNV